MMGRLDRGDGVVARQGVTMTTASRAGPLFGGNYDDPDGFRADGEGRGPHVDKRRRPSRPTRGPWRVLAGGGAVSSNIRTGVPPLDRMLRGEPHDAW